MMDFQKKRFQLLGFIIGVIILSFTAEKFRQIMGETGSSQSGKFTIFNCFDGGSGTVACLVKEGVKLYTYNIRTVHVESARNKAIETSLADAISQGIEPIAAAKKAQQDGAKAAKQATRKAKRIIGPIISSGWDFFEAIYYGGTVTEGFLRGTGTLFGTYFVGYLGEERFGRFGYLVGSQFGSWIGGRMGLMVYDIVNGVYFVLQFGQPEENLEQKVDFFQGGQSQTEENVQHTDYWASFLETVMGYVSSYMPETSKETSKDVSFETYEEVDTYESPIYESHEAPDYESYESPVYESNEEL